MKNSNENPTVNNLGVSTDINHPTYEEIIESVSFGEMAKIEYEMEEYQGYEYEYDCEEFVDLYNQQMLVNQKIQFEILSELEKYDFSKDKYDSYIKKLSKKILDCFDNGNIRKSLYDIHMIALRELTPLFSDAVLDMYPNYFMKTPIINIIKHLQSVIDDENIVKEIPYVFFTAFIKRKAFKGSDTIIEVMDYNFYKKNFDKISEETSTKQMMRLYVEADSRYFQN